MNLKCKGRRRQPFFLYLVCITSCFLLPTLSVLAEGREVLNLNPDWKFIKADPVGAQAPDFNDRGWATVSVPHTYNDVDTFDDLSPGRMLGETNQWSGRTWYRKTFTLPTGWQGRRVYVEFEGVRQVAEVYLNGRLLGTSKNGFVPFGFDLTAYVEFGKPNVLAVMCDNRFMISQVGGETKNGKAPAGKKDQKGGNRHNDYPAGTLSAYEKRVNETLPDGVDELQADQIPWNNPQWHPPLGGIYRNVRLYVTDPLHITLPLYDYLQTTGPYVYATNISDKAADIGIEIPVANGRAGEEKITVRARVQDRGGHTVLTLQKAVTVASGAKTTIKLAGTLSKPRLWEPAYPYLYKVVCSIQRGDETVDATEVPFGIRAVHWDVRTGFWINGHHLKLHGWGQRPTDEWPGLGTAQPDWLHYYTLNLMKEAGGNFLRWGHCAGGPGQIRAGDELGLATDQPGVDGEADTVGAAWEVRAAAFRDVIIYYRNHPSILIWEGGNQKVSQAHAEELHGFVEQYDPYGGRAYAHRRADETTGKFMDISIGTEGSHEVPRLPVVEGEYDREESPRRVWDDASPPDFGYPAAKGQTYDLTSEQFAVNEVSQYVEKVDMAGHCGGANWLFSDSTSGGRNTVEVDRASGEVDGVRLPKEAYYVCQTMFRKNPQVHIIGHWNYPAGTKKTVYVASNCQQVKLLVNAKEVGTTNATKHYLFTFPEVEWQAGEIEAIAIDDGVPVATNTIRTAGNAVALRLTPIMGPGGLQADGVDVVLIDVEAVDAKGERCPTFEKRVNFTCAGPGIWRGGYDSGKAGSINHEHLDLEAGINRVAVRSTLEPGTILVTASCAGLKPGNVTIPSRLFPVEAGYSTLLPALPETTLAEAHPDWSGLAQGTAPMTVTTATRADGKAGRYTESFSYTGPTELVHVEMGVRKGRNVYCDRAVVFEELPVELEGADWVQAAEADRGYSAADLVQLAVKGGTAVYVAHDAGVVCPGWLRRQFVATQETMEINGRAMRIYRRAMKQDESLTLGSNGNEAVNANCNMYVVFVTRPDPDYHASR